MTRVKTLFLFILLTLPCCAWMHKEKIDEACHLFSSVPDGAFIKVDSLKFPWDTDKDGINDVHDNCPNIPNSDQLDTNQDGFGDACNADSEFTSFTSCVAANRPTSIQRFRLNGGESASIRVIGKTFPISDHHLCLKIEAWNQTGSEVCLWKQEGDKLTPLPDRQFRTHCAVDVLVFHPIQPNSDPLSRTWSYVVSLPETEEQAIIKLSIALDFCHL